jgi:diacylglycerol kinase family enzyme
VPAPTPAAATGADERGVARARNSIKPHAVAMTGPHSVNVDGELAGFAPVRLRVVPGAVRVLCA